MGGKDSVYGNYAMNGQHSSNAFKNLDDVQINSDFNQLSLNRPTNSRQNRAGFTQNSKNILESPEKNFMGKPSSLAPSLGLNSTGAQENNLFTSSAGGSSGIRGGSFQFNTTRMQRPTNVCGPFHGLENPKLYTCYMNSILQAFVATPNFLASMASLKGNPMPNRKSQYKGKISTDLIELFQFY